MNLDKYFNPKESSVLIGYEKKFNLFRKIIEENKFPKAILISGNKGLGKSTFVNHLMHFYFDKDNYNEKNNTILKKGFFSSQYKENLFPNINYLPGSAYKNVTIEDVRNLKNKLSKTPINNLKRFIILDDVETYNINSLNALLKIVEEPGENNYFILINNKTKTLISTIQSRCVEIKIMLNDDLRNKIISSLIKIFDQKILFDKDLVKVTPGNFLIFNYIFNEKKLSLKNDLITNSKSILNLYKKEKNYTYKNLLLFLVEYYLQEKRFKNHQNNKKFIDNISFILKNINDFFSYNLNQNTLLSSIENKINE